MMADFLWEMRQLIKLQFVFWSVTWNLDHKVHKHSTAHISAHIKFAHLQRNVKHILVFLKFEIVIIEIRVH